VTLAIKSADGKTKRRLIYPNVALRDECNGSCPAAVPNTKGSLANAFFFSTFHGGNETKRLTCVDVSRSSLTNVVPRAMPNFPGLTQARFDELCATQLLPTIYPVLTWNPQTVTAARFDNIIVTEGYTNAAF
jgi:hypothetical protein